MIPVLHMLTAWSVGVIVKLNCAHWLHVSKLLKKQTKKQSEAKLTCSGKKRKKRNKGKKRRKKGYFNRTSTFSGLMPFEATNSYSTNIIIMKKPFVCFDQSFQF